MNTKTISPLVTVGMPVYNEEKYIGETLESIINQDYENLEILISDNYSNDKTSIICKEYAKKDKRINYYWQSKNIGATANHYYVIRKARGKYFMWAAGHDKWSTNLVSQCVSHLENFQTATIAFGTPIWIGKDGKSFNKFSGWYDSHGLNPVTRFFITFWGSMNPILGIVRRKDIPNIKNYNYTGADLVFLAELALKGEFIHVVESIFYRRQIRAMENHDERMKRYKSEETKIANTYFTRLFPLAKLPFQLLRVVTQAKISILEKVFILIILLPSLPIRYFIGKKDYNPK